MSGQEVDCIEMGPAAATETSGAPGTALGRVPSISADSNSVCVSLQHRPHAMRNEAQPRENLGGSKSQENGPGGGDVELGNETAENVDEASNAQKTLVTKHWSVRAAQIVHAEVSASDELASPSTSRQTRLAEVTACDFDGAAVSKLSPSPMSFDAQAVQAGNSCTQGLEEPLTVQAATFIVRAAAQRVVVRAGYLRSCMCALCLRDRLKTMLARNAYENEHRLRERQEAARTVQAWARRRLACGQYTQNLLAVNFLSALLKTAAARSLYDAERTRATLMERERVALVSAVSPPGRMDEQIRNWHKLHAKYQDLGLASFGTSREEATARETVHRHLVLKQVLHVQEEEKLLQRQLLHQQRLLAHHQDERKRLHPDLAVLVGRKLARRKVANAFARMKLAVGSALEAEAVAVEVMDDILHSVEDAANQRQRATELWAQEQSHREHVCARIEAEIEEAAHRLQATTFLLKKLRHRSNGNEPEEQVQVLLRRITRDRYAILQPKTESPPPVFQVLLACTRSVSEDSSLTQGHQSSTGASVVVSAPHLFASELGLARKFQKVVAE